MVDAFLAIRANQIPFMKWNDATAFRLNAAQELAGDWDFAGDRYVSRGHVEVVMYEASDQRTDQPGIEVPEAQLGE
jgi:hypothetical protein